MAGPKYVKDFSFPTSAGFTGSATDRATVPVRAHERAHAARGGAKKDWIQGAIKHPGALRKTLGVKEGEKILAKKLNEATHSSNPTTRRRANLAKTLRKMNKAEGGRVHERNRAEEDLRHLRDESYGAAKALASLERSGRYHYAKGGDVKKGEAPKEESKPKDTKQKRSSVVDVLKGGERRRREKELDLSHGGRAHYAKGGSVKKDGALTKRANAVTDLDAESGGRTPLRPGFAGGGPVKAARGGKQKGKKSVYNC